MSRAGDRARYADHGQHHPRPAGGRLNEYEILAEYPTLTVEGIRAAAYGAELARDEYPAVGRGHVRIKLDENLPESAVSTPVDAGHDTDTTHAEGLDGTDDPDVLAGASADGRLLIALDRGLGDIRAYPPGGHGGVLIIRLNHQSPRTIRRTVERVSTTADLDDLAGCIAVWRDGNLRVRRP